MREVAKIRIDNAKKLPDGTIYHESYVEEGQIKVGETVKIIVDADKKLSSARNHTATHLLQAALRKIVGEQVHQAGSLVTPERLRFDFSNFEPVTPAQIAAVEEMVNEEILKAADVDIKQMKIDDAKKLGAMALFGEKYGDVVRVVSVPNFSTGKSADLKSSAKVALQRACAELRLLQDAPQFLTQINKLKF